EVSRQESVDVARRIQVRTAEHPGRLPELSAPRKAHDHDPDDGRHRARGTHQKLRPLCAGARSLWNRSPDLQARDRRHQDAEGRLELLFPPIGRDVAAPFRRAIVIVMDSVGSGELPDAAAYGDQGSDTLGNIAKRVGLAVPTLRALGLGRVAAL